MNTLKDSPQFIYCVVDKFGTVMHTFTESDKASYAANEPQYHGGRQMTMPWRVVKYEVSR